MTLFLKYSLCAVIATCVNLATQSVFFFLIGGVSWAIYLAIFSGTVAGLVTKYFLDKKWIFSFKTGSPRDSAKIFSLYALVGVFTTIIFWGFEMVFYLYADFNGSQYIGGSLGLALGYTCKYQLDKKFVFKRITDEN